MTHPPLRISDFSYTLPDNRIAAFPKPDRDSSKLLICRNDITEDHFRNIARHLPPNSLIVFNDSRVVEARLVFHKPTGARIEVFCLEPDNRYPDVTTAFAAKGQVFWKCLVGNAAAWSPDLVLEKLIDGHSISARLVSRESDHFIISLSWSQPQLSFAEVLHLAGAVPLPPYIKRSVETSDAERYQTIYAHLPGSVAAPTAGLHFTPFVMQQLEERQIESLFVTLHVGAGTFKPVKTESVSEHEMHSEFIEVKKEAIGRLLDGLSTPVTAVGTTSLRTLESLYWLGVKRLMQPESFTGIPEVKQWDPYEMNTNIGPKEALSALLSWLDQNNTDLLLARTSLMIVPSYQFRIVSVLVTNFHQPRSTLLLLIAAFIGEKWKSAYAYALEHDFRFLSYGDSCLLFRN